ncbi:7294_t:CDS:2, partial [Dentiscutata erythropus]
MVTVAESKSVTEENVKDTTTKLQDSSNDIDNPEENVQKSKKNQSKIKRRKKKKNHGQQNTGSRNEITKENGKDVEAEDEEKVEIEYVYQPLDVSNDPYFEEFSKVFAHFQISKDETE